MFSYIAQVLSVIFPLFALKYISSYTKYILLSYSIEVVSHLSP